MRYPSLGAGPESRRRTLGQGAGGTCPATRRERPKFVNSFTKSSGVVAIPRSRPAVVATLVARSGYVQRALEVTVERRSAECKHPASTQTDYLVSRSSHHFGTGPAWLGRTTG